MTPRTTVLYCQRYVLACGTVAKGLVYHVDGGQHQTTSDQIRSSLFYNVEQQLFNVLLYRVDYDARSYCTV